MRAVLVVPIAVFVLGCSGRAPGRNVRAAAEHHLELARAPIAGATCATARSAPSSSWSYPLGPPSASIWTANESSACGGSHAVAVGSRLHMTLEALYGPFAPVFEKGELKVPGYLELLSLRGSGAQIVIDRIAAALQHGDSSRWITALFQDRNWRPHLVGAIALLLEPSLGHELLWHGIDEGSWVTPQLVVTATFLDVTFREQAQRRVAALCPLVMHVGTRAGETVHSPKMLASVIAASVELPDLAPWRAEVLQDGRVQKLLAEDASWDRSDRIVTSWLAAVRAAFLVRGYTLAASAK